ILANHYMKNGVALFFAGMYFASSEADTWRKKGWKILVEELDEQFLADGGHYERSPMYHSICVTDYLDVLNLVESSKPAVNSEEKGKIKRTVSAGLIFCILSACRTGISRFSTTHPSGSLPAHPRFSASPSG